MADCEYQIKGDDMVYSESELKQLLSEGYLDKLMVENNLKIRGIKPDENLASSFKLLRAVVPEVQPAEITETVTPTAEITETVTPEVKTEEVVTPTETVTEEKSFDDKVAEEVSKIINPISFEEDAERLIAFNKKMIESTQKYMNGDISAKDYNGLLYTNDALINGKRISEFSNEELKNLADNQAKNKNELINKARQKVQSETVTKTEEVVTPTTEAKVEEQVTEPTAKKQRLQISTPLTENEQRVAARGEGVNQLYVIQDALQKDKKYKTKKVSQYEIALSKGETTYSEVKEAIESAGIKVPDYIEKFNPENKKQPTKEAVAAKNLADFLRRGKSEKGTIMASPLPGFNQVWDATIETVAKAIEVGGVTVGNFRKSINDGVRAFKNTDTYKAITDPEERKKITSEYRKALLEKVPKFYNVDPTEDFGNVWDSSTEIVNDSLSKSDKSPAALQKAIDEGFKDVKKSTWYNSLGKDQKQQFAADYNEAMNRMFPIKKEKDKEKATKETVSQEEKEKGKEFKGKVSEATGTAKPEKTIRLSESELLRMQIKYGNQAGKETIKNLQNIKEQIRDYAKENLPKDDYSAKEVNSLMRSISAARTQKGLESALDKIDTLVARKLEKQAKKDRASLIKDIESKIANNSKKVISKNRRTGAKKGKITIESQQQINQVIQDLKDQGLFKNLDILSDTELNDLNNTIDNILETGRVEQKQLEAVNDAKKRADKAIIFQALAGDSDDVLNGKEQVQERFKQSNGYVIVDKQLMSASDFKDYINKNPDVDLNDVPFYYKSESIDKVKSKLDKDLGLLKTAKDATLFNIVDLETHIKNLGAKSPELKKWLEDNIGRPLREAKRKEVEALWRETKQYKKDINKIFGTYSVNTKEFFRNKWRTKTVNIPKVYDTLVAPSDITPKNSEESLSAGEVVTLYMIVYNTNPEIKDKYKLDSKEAEKDMKILMRENYVDPQKIYDFMHKPENKSLLDFAHFLSEKYNEDARAMFGPTIEQFHQIALGNTYYHPKLRSSSTLEPESIMNLEQDKSLSVTSPNMRHRTDNASAPFKIINAHELYLNYLKSMTHAKEYIPVVKAAQTLLTDVNKPYIMEKLGSVSDYNDMVKALSIAVTDKSPFESGAMSGLTNWTALTMLWFRVKSIPQQASSFVHYYTAGIKDGVMPWDIVNTVPITKEEREFAAKFYSDNPYLWTRLSGGNITPEMQKLKEQTDSLSNEILKGTLSLTRFTGLIGIKFGDFAAAATPGGGASFALAQFKKKFEETKDYQSARDFAIQRWYEETERTGQVSLAREIMSTQSFNTLVRLFIPFSSAQQGMGKKAYKAYLDLKDFENLNNKERAQAIADLIYFPLLAPVPFFFAGNAGAALSRMLFDDEEDETLEEAQKKRIYYDLIADTAQSNATALGFPGLLFNFAMNIARDRAGFNQSPAYQRLTDIGTELVSLLRSNQKWEDLTSSERKRFIKEYESENGSLNGKDVKEIYNNTIISEKQINVLLKSIGAKNIKDLIESINKLAEDKDFWSFFFDLETRDEEINKKLDPYFNQAIKNKKKDELYEFLSRLQRYFENEDYKVEGYIPEEGKKTKSRGSSKPSFPRIEKPKISKPKIPKF
jgi:hypothetical protein